MIEFKQVHSTLFECLPLKLNDASVETLFKQFEGLLQNHDVAYFFTLAFAISIPNGRSFLQKKYGKIPPAPGTQDGSRFLNDGSGAMRVYIQTESPSLELYRIVYIALNFYGPLHIEIKREPNITNGAKHFFRAMQLLKGLDKKEQAHCKKHFEINSFMAHFENVALSAIYDTDSKIRKWAFEKICVANNLNDPSSVRQFIKPKTLNWEAKHYTELFDPLAINSVPPLLQEYTKDRNGFKILQKHVITGTELPIPKLKCHSTSTGTYIFLYIFTL